MAAACVRPGIADACVSVWCARALHPHLNLRTSESGTKRALVALVLVVSAVALYISFGIGSTTLDIESVVRRRSLRNFSLCRRTESGFLLVFSDIYRNHGVSRPLIDQGSVG